MKTWLLILVYLFTSFGDLNSQVVIYSETFDSGSPNWGTLNQPIGVQGITPNIFYISNTEAGLAAGNCGVSGGADLSLHLSSTTAGDVGAAYDASVVCLPGCFICDFLGPAFCSDVTTDVRSESISFSTVGHTGMTITFDYMEFGDLANDNCELYYNIGGGWVLWTDLPKTLCCGGAACTGFVQGLWTAFSAPIPVAMENQANVQIGFRWYNNADGAGTDPSFAVDDISITKPAVLPVDWLSFDIQAEGFNANIKWTTSSEINSDKFILQRSSDAINYEDISEVKAAGNSTELRSYTVIDHDLSPGTYYYRIKQTDLDAHFELSETRIIKISEGKIIDLLAYPNPSTGQVTVKFRASDSEEVELHIVDQRGRIVAMHNLLAQRGVSSIDLDLSKFEAGPYTIKATTKDQIKHVKILLIP